MFPFILVVLAAALSAVSGSAVPNGPARRDTLTGSGSATWFPQNGMYGACGQLHQDSDLVVALDIDLYGPPSTVTKYCGKNIQVTNTNNNKTVSATVADVCVTCSGSGSMDMSIGAFIAIAREGEGLIPVRWVMDL